MTKEKINVLDNGYVRLIESWGKGDAGINEAGIIEAARQSTQGNFRGWDEWICNKCGAVCNSKLEEHINQMTKFSVCDGKLISDNGLLSHLFNNKPPHSTPFEFCGMTIEVKAPIFVFREWHRHRTQSYNEMSARYSPLPNENYVPTLERLFITQENNKQAQSIDGSEQLTEFWADEWLQRLDNFYREAEHIYQSGLSFGIPKEVARVCLPVGRYSQMRASANMLNWLKFLTLRTDSKAQYEIRVYAEAVKQIMEQEFPRTMELFNNLKEK